MIPQGIDAAVAFFCEVLSRANFGSPADAPLLPIVRLRPGEDRALELALTDDPSRPPSPPGGDVFRLYVLAADSAPRLVAPEPKSGRFRVAEGLQAIWRADRLEIGLRADDDARRGPVDLRLEYDPFASSRHAVRVRVVVAD